MNLDEVDRELLSLVQADARSTLAKLASRTRP
jgi:DNA-binding Lrp family transcriptional regulator